MDFDPTANTPLPEPRLIELAEDPAEVESDPLKMVQYDCQSCGYTYEPSKGDQLARIPVGVLFEDLPITWKCPVCSADKSRFEAVGAKGKPSGFKENLGYGLGVNVMTPGQKNLLIFLGLAVGFAFLMSFYLIE